MPAFYTFLLIRACRPSGIDNRRTVLGIKYLGHTPRFAAAQAYAYQLPAGTQQNLTVVDPAQLEAALHGQALVAAGQPGRHFTALAEKGCANIIVVGAADHHGGVQFAVIVQVQAQRQ